MDNSLNQTPSHPIKNIPLKSFQLQSAFYSLSATVLRVNMQVIAIEKYHHEEHEGHKGKRDCEILRDLRVLRGRQYSIMSLEPTV